MMLGMMVASVSPDWVDQWERGLVRFVSWSVTESDEWAMASQMHLLFFYAHYHSTKESVQTHI